MLAWCVVSAVCAAVLAVLLLRMRSSASIPLWMLVLGTLLFVPGQVSPLFLLWQAWHRTYFIIPFVGAPIRVGVAAVWWAAGAVGLSYLPGIVYACRGQWSWMWVALHPCGTARLLWRGWAGGPEKRG